MRKWVIPILFVVLILLCVNLLAKDYQSIFQGDPGPITIVIDPGHGGNDPGKVGVNDALEKEINLKIAIRLKEYLESQGIEVVMTRETDQALYSEGAKNKKREDLNARVDIINSSDAALVISIHQNSYEEQNCKGSQVFYYKGSEKGQKLAECLKASMLTNVDGDNKRDIKANSSYFLLKQSNSTVAIIECGFLSNPHEAELLATEAYQNKVAYGISEGVLSYLKQ